MPAKITFVLLNLVGPQRNLNLFSWDDYLAKTGSIAAAWNCFKQVRNDHYLHALKCTLTIVEVHVLVNKINRKCFCINARYVLSAGFCSGMIRRMAKLPEKTRQLVICFSLVPIKIFSPLFFVPGVSLIRSLFICVLCYLGSVYT